MPETKTDHRGYLEEFGSRVEEFGSRVEEGASQFMKTWKTQAKRPDMVGDVTYRGLELVHDGLGVAARSLTRLERATQLPHRIAKPEPPAVEAPAKRPAHAAPTHHGTRPERREPEPAAS